MMQKVRDSKNLAELENILEEVKEHFDRKTPDPFKVMKQQFDEKVLHGRYSHIIGSREKYAEWIRKTKEETKKLDERYY